MSKYAEQIAAYEAKRASLVAGMEEIMSKAADEGATLDAEQQEAYDGHEKDVEAIDAHLKRLKAMEKVAAATAKPISGQTLKEGSDSRGLAPVTIKQKENLVPGGALARLIKVKSVAKIEGETRIDVARKMYGENSNVYGFFAKTAVPAGSTLSGSWAEDLVGTETSAFADFVEYLRPQTILGKFGANGIPSLRRVPFRTALVGQTEGGDGYWVGEGNPKPLTKFDFTRTTLEPLKVANIAVLTMEVLRDSSPSAEMIVRDQLAAALRARLDTDFIDPGKIAASGVSPASITNAVSPIGSSGSDAEAVREDIRQLFNTFIAANNAPTSGVFIMAATTALALSLMQNPLGQAEFPGISMNGGTLFGLPVIVSEYVGSDTGGSYVFLVNASDIYLADEGGITIDMSREASLQMDDAPTSHDSTTPTATSLVSLWQTNSVGFLAERTINWAKRRASAVAVLNNVMWGVPST